MACSCDICENHEPHAEVLSKMRRARFCAVISSNVQSSRRLSEAVLSGCIPVRDGRGYIAVGDLAEWGLVQGRGMAECRRGWWGKQGIFLLSFVPCRGRATCRRGCLPQGVHGQHSKPGLVQRSHPARKNRLHWPAPDPTSPKPNPPHPRLPQVFIGPPFHTLPLAKHVDYASMGVFIEVQDTSLWINRSSINWEHNHMVGWHHFHFGGMGAGGWVVGGWAGVALWVSINWEHKHMVGDVSTMGGWVNGGAGRWVGEDAEGALKGRVEIGEGSS